MFSDLMKHQSVFSVPKNFLSKLPKRITLNEYLVKRLNHDGIFYGFGSNKYLDYSPFYGFLREYDNFDIINDNKNEHLIPYYAKSYHKHTNKTGIMFNSKYGYTNLISGITKANEEGIPLLLISFYNSAEEFLIPQQNIFKDKYRLSHSSDRFPNLLEYMLQLSNMSRKGVTHIQIENSILNQQINIKS